MGGSATTVVRIVARAVLRRWTANCGGDPARAMGYLGALAVACPVLGVAAGAWTGGHVGGSWPEDLRVPAVAGTSLLASGVAVMLKSTDIEASDTGAALAPLPLEPGLRALALYAPVIVVSTLLVALTGPALAQVLVSVGGFGPAAGSVLALVLVAQGLLTGLVLVGLARRLTRVVPVLDGLAYPAAVAGWVAALAAGLAHGRGVAGARPSGVAGPVADVVLGWPLVLGLAEEPGVGAGAALAAQLCGLVALTGALLVVPCAAVAERAGRVRPPVLRWRPSGPLPLARVEALRLVRTRRVVASVAASAVLVGTAVGAVALRGGDDTGAVARSALFPLAIASAHVAMVARGISRRHRPYQLTLGYPTREWSSSVVASALGVWAVVWLPFVALLGLLTGSVSTVSIGVGLGFFVACASSVVGAVLTPGQENVGGELASFVIVATAAVVVSQAVARLVGESSPAVAVPFVVIGAGLLAVPPLVERRRWRRDTISMGAGR